MYVRQSHGKDNSNITKILCEQKYNFLNGILSLILLHFLFGFSFTVKSVMAPVSQLLVYYITPEGEPISDVISFDVKLLHKQVRDVLPWVHLRHCRYFIIR